MSDRFQHHTAEELLTLWDWVEDGYRENMTEQAKSYYEDLIEEMTKRNLLPRSKEHDEHPPHHNECQSSLRTH